MSTASPSPTQSSQLQAKHLKLRRMRDEDVPHLMPIESVSFGSHHWSMDSFYNELQNQMSRYYSLFHKQENGDEKLIGYGGYWMVFDEVHITTLAVDPSLRGSGLGELMLLQILDKCMGQSVKWLTLEVRSSNEAAQNLYYKYGFELMGVRPKYYQDNQENALILTTHDINSETFRTLFKQHKARVTEKLGGLPSGYDG